MVPGVCSPLSSTPNPLPPVPAAPRCCCYLLKGAKVPVAAEVLAPVPQTRPREQHCKGYEPLCESLCHLCPPAHGFCHEDVSI